MLNRVSHTNADIQQANVPVKENLILALDVSDKDEGHMKGV